MKIGFYIMVRDKVNDIRKSVESALAQTYQPLTIYLSDQGSVDGTREILDEIKATYKGPHDIVRLNAPADVPFSMVGLTRHFNWLVDNTDADLMLMQSGDDYSDPERTARTVEVWLKHKPSYIGTRIRVETPGNTGEVRTPAFTGNGFVSGADSIEKKIGGSVTCAFDREFWNKIGPLTELMLQDVTMPFMAAQDRGFFVIPELLAAYVLHASEKNAGLGGQWLAVSRDEAKRRQMEELLICEVTTGLVGTLQPFAEGRLKFKNPSEEAALKRLIVQRAVDWAIARRNLHAVGLRPIAREA